LSIYQLVLQCHIHQFINLYLTSDLSDESGCPPRYDNGRYCSEDRFECANNLCVRQTDLCDGRDDCGDGSDEDEDMCSKYKMKRLSDSRVVVVNGRVGKNSDC
jgi:hypothetical protein